MLDQIHPLIPNADPYATTADLLAVQDIPEVDITVVRWTASGAALKLRVRGLDLPKQDAIQLAALVKNPKTGLWEQSRVLFAIETLRIGVRVPELDAATAKALLGKNPTVINALVDFIWGLAGYTDELLEQAAHALLPTDADAAALAEPSDAPGADGEPLA